MGLRITSDFLLASLLANKQSVSWQEIRSAADAIYGTFPKETRVYVHACRDDILGTVQGSPDVFRSQEDSIRRAEPHDSRFLERDFIIPYLGRDLNSEIAVKVYELLQRPLSPQ